VAEVILVRLLMHPQAQEFDTQRLSLNQGAVVNCWTAADFLRNYF